MDALQPTNHMNYGRGFGRHVRSLRRARGHTQEVLADRCGLSADTIRRLEHGSFSPSLDTLHKLCGGLDLQLSTLFESYELGESRRAAELIDLVSSHSDARIKLATSVVRALFDGLDELAQSEELAELAEGEELAEGDEVRESDEPEQD